MFVNRNNVPKCEQIQAMSWIILWAAMAKTSRNAIGPQLARHRNSLAMSQADFVAHCQRSGWDLSRETLAKIEAGFRCVSDVELLEIAKCLKVSVPSLFPASKQYLFKDVKK